MPVRDLPKMLLSIVLLSIVTYFDSDMCVSMEMVVMGQTLWTA